MTAGFAQQYFESEEQRDHFGGQKSDVGDGIFDFGDIGDNERCENNEKIEGIGFEPTLSPGELEGHNGHQGHEGKRQMVGQLCMGANDLGQMSMCHKKKIRDHHEQNCPQHTDDVPFKKQPNHA